VRRYTCLPGDGTIRSGDFALATVQDEHLEAIRVWRNAQMDVLRQAEPIEPLGQVRYFETHIWPTLAERHPPNILLAFQQSGRLLGYGGLVHIAWDHRRAEISFLLDPQYIADPALYARYFSTFLDLLKRLAFAGLSLHRLFTETFDTRAQHVKVLEEHGFEPEGRMRQHVRIGERWVDSLLHGCLNAHE
jgi:RimJ/RimL family protein N-acetyltransferase